MHREVILVADDEKTIRESLSRVLTEAGFEVVPACDGEEALRFIQSRRIDVAMLDIRMPKIDGLAVLSAAREASPGTAVIMITAFSSVDSAVQAVKLGASDYVAKPFVFDDILIKIERLLSMRRLVAENLALHWELEGSNGFGAIVGSNSSLKNAMHMVEKLAQTRATALITGESGTGKEVIARAIHYSGVTKASRFVPVNCSALPDTLVESELFGYRRGAFTGALQDKAGVFQLADGGTAFFDEICNMPLGTQAKLLRAIEEKLVTPLGGTEPVAVDVRILCAANCDLGRLVADKRFRPDLYYRLNVVEIHLPPLRERLEDVPALANHFVNKFNRELGKHCPGVTDRALEAMVHYAWPGNIRELKNIIERAMILGQEGKPIDVSDLTFLDKYGEGAPEDCCDLKSALRNFERQRILNALRENAFDKAATAEALHIGLSSLYRKCEELGIPRREGHYQSDAL